MTLYYVSMYIGIQFDAPEFTDVRECRVQFVGRIPGFSADPQFVGKRIPMGIRRQVSEDGQQCAAHVDQFFQIWPTRSGNYYWL